MGIDAAYPNQFTELANRGVTFGVNANGFATAATNPEGESTVTVQDGLGRTTIMMIDGSGHITTQDYDTLIPALDIILMVNGWFIVMTVTKRKQKRLNYLSRTKRNTNEKNIRSIF